MVNNELDRLYSLAFRKLLKYLTIFIILFGGLIYLFIFATETN
jgi:hypothetical protein